MHNHNRTTPLFTVGAKRSVGSAVQLIAWPPHRTWINLIYSTGHVCFLEGEHAMLLMPSVFFFFHYFIPHRERERENPEAYVCGRVRHVAWRVGVLIFFSLWGQKASFLSKLSCHGRFVQQSVTADAKEEKKPLTSWIVATPPARCSPSAGGCKQRVKRGTLW